MKNLLIKTTLLMFIISFFSIDVQAQCFLGDDGKYYNIDGTPCNNVVLTAVPFLRIAPDARSGAMGDAGIGVSPDANAMHYNASKLVFAEEDFAIAANYSPWLRSLGLNDVYLAYLAGYYRINELQSIGVGLKYFSLGSIPFTDENGEALITGKPNEFEIKASYARKLSDKFSAAVGAKFIYSNLAAGQELNGDIIEPGLAGAADISFTYHTPIKMENANSNLTIGLALTNIGNKITYTRNINRDFLPSNFGLGAAWEVELDGFNTITIAADLNKLMVPTPCQGDNCDEDGNDIADYRELSPVQGIFSSFSDAPEGFSEELKEIVYSFGLEYWYDKQFAVRAGYFYEHPQKGARKYFTAGVGLKYNIFGLNFSYLIPTSNQHNPLDNTLRFTLLFDFGNYEG